ncbi:alpha/beta hydrolase [Frankia sp. CNm7]|uniref:Alpha/beta hydrolase n=1 Tax=Frankia nepalensis TaxID=1836974 RepID=A0A937RAR3_9ACTN|nr:alpha/beta hydrolase [Frankia nepalensis]MBL7494742.1 alpha/beta hydrolase [Frankia nepalensis]MBL7516224.1 alpha/beta hydrolase [Frankia nepalensis]MBL7519910.1 alpha/beta hydrolase [Frankia nepalensis]MBL7626857.1 alpha/beta hydrolase [Frankia nepalensis]
MAEVVANGVRLHVQRLAPAGGPRPDAPVVVMLHGMVIDNLASFYFSLGNALADAGCEVVCYDLRGHGKSERTPSGYGIANAMADLTALLDELGIDRPVHLVGNSYGATLGLTYGVEHAERVASLTLIEPPFRIEGLGEEMARSLTQVLAAISDEEVEEWLAFSAGRAVGRIMRSAQSLLRDTTISEDMLATTPFSPDRLRTLPVPVLAVYGGNSEIIEQGEGLANLVPDCTLVVLEHHTHMVLREAVDYLRELLRWWLLRRDEPIPVHEFRGGKTFELADWVLNRTVPTDLNAERRAAEATPAGATSQAPAASGASAGVSGES